MFILAVYDADEIQAITDDDFSLLLKLARTCKRWIILALEIENDNGELLTIAESK